MERARWRAVAATLLATALSLGASTSAADAGDIDRGRSLYLGASAQAMPTSTSPPACVGCHRRSGLGSFEGGLAVPPIAGRLLFDAHDDDTGRFFGEVKRYRQRPVYDAASLGTLLRSGVAPDGRLMDAAMPRYPWTDRQIDDLAAYLRTLASGDVPGLDAHSIHLATITTPEADTGDVAAALAVLRAYIDVKNRQSRQESRRAVIVDRAREMAKHRKFRLWRLSHWALKGGVETWAAQLEAWQAADPAFAVVSGVGGMNWQPVHAFCEARRLPCLLPLLQAAPAAVDAGNDFYSVYFHAGIDTDARVAAHALREAGVQLVSLWARPEDAGRAARTRAVLQVNGVAVATDSAARTQAVVSLLPPMQQRARSAQQRAGTRMLAWLPGAQVLTGADVSLLDAWRAGSLLVTPMPAAERAEAELARSAAWLRAQGLQDLSRAPAAAALQAATVLADGLVHIDFDFTREYLLELLEHGLENMLSYGPYARLSIAPGQRVASKGSYVGIARGDGVEWSWRTAR